MQNVNAPEISRSAAQTDSQTFCLIVFPRGVEEAVIGILEEVGVPGFTYSEKVTGRGPHGRHFDNPIWPGADGAIFTVTSLAQAAQVSAALVDFSRRLEQQSRALYGVHVFTWACQQLA